MKGARRGGERGKWGGGEGERREERRGGERGKGEGVAGVEGEERREGERGPRAGHAQADRGGDRRRKEEPWC